ncbi:hypothetical protein OUZ56_027845 [Daphnia magna]|uniref:Uncharacterized protein n=1 Tax=Daphnia magna TaxID=35525 RepID=A0ABR0B2Q8_9CRUS|nr:hypothetical protein OUZ56_027845 [Daphnia magna]
MSQPVRVIQIGKGPFPAYFPCGHRPPDDRLSADEQNQGAADDGMHSSSTQFSRSFSSTRQFRPRYVAPAAMLSNTQWETLESQASVTRKSSLISFFCDLRIFDVQTSLQ